MPLLGAAIMDTERMIPNSRSSQNGSSPGSGQSGPTYHNASAAISSTHLHNSSSQPGLVVNSVARKKKTERLVPPLIPNHSGLVNGSNSAILAGTNGGYMNSTSIYSPMGTFQGLSNPGFTRDNMK